MSALRNSEALSIDISLIVSVALASAKILRSLGPNEDGVTIHVKAPDRASRQDISDLDSKMGVFSAELTKIREEAEPETLAWYPFIEQAVTFTNKKRIRTARAMGVAPNKAEASFAEAKEGGEPSAKQVTAFVLQQQTAKDREHNRKIQNKAHDELAKPENQAFRVRIPPRSSMGREYRARDPKWTDKVYKLDTAAGDKGFQGGEALTKLPATKYRGPKLMGFKATKVEIVPKGSKDTNYTSLATFKDVSKYEDAREALRPWAVYVVRYLQGEPGQMGRVRAIDRDLKLQRPQVKDVMAEFLPRNRLPLALYEISQNFLTWKVTSA